MFGLPRFIDERGKVLGDAKHLERRLLQGDSTAIPEARKRATALLERVGLSMNEGRCWAMRSIPLPDCLHTKTDHAPSGFAGFSTLAIACATPRC